MIRSLSAFTTACLLLCIHSGCALQQTCLTHDHQPAKIGWVTISGTAIPSTTTPVDEYGKSLADCILDSRVNEILQLQQRLRDPAADKAGFRQPTQADSARLAVTLQSFEAAVAPIGLYADTVAEVSALQLSLPGLQMPAWAEGFPHYAFDPRVATDQDRAQLRFQLESLEDQNIHQEAVLAFTILNNPNSPEKDRETSLKYLSVLARDGKFRVGDDQISRAWSYKVIGDFEKSKRARLTGTADAVSAAIWTTTVLNSLQTDRTSFVADSSTLAESAFVDSEPGNSIFAVIEQPKQPITVVPFDQVLNGPLGSLWMFPGDHISLMRLNDIYFLNGQQGDKRIGVTGMVTQKGILPTKVNRLNQLMGEVDSNIDIRSNLIVVNYPVGEGVARLFVPYTSPTVAQSSDRVEQLYRHIGLTNGTVITMDHTDVTPALKRSRLLLQRATEARLSPTKVCSLQTEQGPVNAVPAKSQTDKRLPRIPVVSDACTLAQKTSKNSWALAENWWQDFGLSW